MDNLIYKSSIGKFVVKQIKGEFVHIEGMASTFGNLDKQGDVIVNGAFKKTIVDPERKVKFLNQHNSDQPIGVIDKLLETDEGLFMMARMPRENSLVKDLVPLLQMGAISDFSIGFLVVEADITPDGNRTIKEIDLVEISLVTMPANPKAKITGVKSDEEVLGISDVEGISTKREFEQMLSDTGKWTKKACIALASRFNEGERRDSVYQKLDQSDSDSKQKALKELDKLNQFFKTRGLKCPQKKMLTFSNKV